MSQTRHIRSWLTAALVGGLLMLPAMGESFAAEHFWIVDETTGCGTSNPFPSTDETIRWYGQCANGRLQGQGTLIWYRGGIEVERNVGDFLNGELHGEAVTSYPDGQSITGQYREGQRHGNFYVRQKDGGYFRATYERGRLLSQAKLSQREVELWKQWRGRGNTIQATAIPRALPSSPAPAPAAPQAVPTSPPAAAIQPPYQPAPAPAPAPAPYPTYQQQPAVYPTYQAQPVQPGYIQPGYVQPAVLLSYNDNVDVGQLFKNLFASSGINAVALPAAASQAAYWLTGAPAIAPTAATYTAYPTAQPYYPTAPPYYPTVASLDPYAAYAALPPVIATPQPQPAVYGYPQQQAVYGYPQQLAVYGYPQQPAVYVNPAQPGASNTADTLFVQGYRLEQDGRFYEAEQTYQQVLLNHPSAPSAMLANARLNELKQDVRRSPVRIEPGPSAGGGALVIAVNSPYPPPTQLPAGMLPVYDHGMVSNSAVLYQTVCSQDGLYEDDAGWCGVVTRDESLHYLVEVRDIRLRSFGTIGITRSTCTGNTFLTWFSMGSTIRVPKQCVTITQ